MKTESFEGTVSSFNGEKIAPAIKFKGTYEAFTSYDELKSSNAVPSNEDVVDFVNTRRKNNERARVMTAELEARGYTKPDPNDAIVVATTMIRNVEKMTLPAEQKTMMIAVLKQQIADEQKRREDAAAEAKAKEELEKANQVPTPEPATVQ